MPSPAPLARRPLLLGVVHLLPLPGSPGWIRAQREGGRSRPAPWLRRALADTQVYAEAGFEGVVVENYGDAPFFAGPLPPETTTALAVAARAVRETFPQGRAVGINALRNDARAAVAVAAALRSALRWCRWRLPRSPSAPVPGGCRNKTRREW